MAEKYPDQYLGIANMQYENNDGVTLESADVVYTDKMDEELLTLQVTGNRFPGGIKRFLTMLENTN